MAYTLRTKDNALDLGRAADQNESVDNDIFFNGYMPRQVFRTVVTGADVASVSFTPISGSFSDLRLSVYARGDKAATSQTCYVQFNNDSGANYDYKTFRLNSATTVGGEEALATTYAIQFVIAGANAPADVFDSNVMNIVAYANAIGEKTIDLHGGVKTVEAGGGVVAQYGAGWWRSTAAITQVDIITEGAQKFKIGSIFTLTAIV